VVKWEKNKGWVIFAKAPCCSRKIKIEKFPRPIYGEREFMDELSSDNSARKRRSRLLKDIKTAWILACAGMPQMNTSA